MAFGFPPLPTPAINYDGKTLGPSWVRFLREMYKLRIGQGAFPDGGQLIEDQALVPFADNSISHTLGRTPVAVAIVRDQGTECAFHVRHAGGAQSITTLETIELDTEQYDYGSHFDTTTYTFTAPVLGLYDFRAGLGVASLADTYRLQCYIQVAGSTFVGSGTVPNGAAANTQVVAACQADLDAGDTITLAGATTDPSGRTVITGASVTYMMGRLIRETWEDASQASASAVVLRTTYAHTVSLWVI